MEGGTPALRKAGQGPAPLDIRPKGLGDVLNLSSIPTLRIMAS